MGTRVLGRIGYAQAGKVLECGSLGAGNCRLCKIESLHTVGMLQLGCPKVAALKLFHPTAPPPFQNWALFSILTQSLARGFLAILLRVLSVTFVAE